MSNSLNPDQDRHCVGPDLGPNCLLRFSADDKSPLTRKVLMIHPVNICIKTFETENFGVYCENSVEKKISTVVKIKDSKHCHCQPF